MIRNKAFTLIELLVVVAIIGVLASIISSSLSDARAQARDAKRHGHIAAIQKQLELYYLENGNYPVSGWISSDESGWSFLDAELGIPTPVDPVNQSPVLDLVVSSNDNYVYSYYATGYGCPGQWYMILYRTEGDLNPESPGVTTCNGTTFNGYPGVITKGVSPVN